LCANAEEVAVTRAIASRAERRKLCRMRPFLYGISRRQRRSNPAVPALLSP
jgi:hypothetical protein